MKEKKEKIIRRLLWAGVIILIITLFVSTTMRLMKLAQSYQSGILPNPKSIDYGYAKNPLLTLLHILPGLLFIVLGALQFVKKIRNKYIRFHRTSGRLYLVLGFIIGISSLAMAFAMQFGGWIETAAILVFAPYFLFSLMNAYKYIRKKEFVLHREWMIRAYSIGIAVATMRPLRTYHGIY
ncbi:MAG: DUF2306 domain-containing protein [Chitinophagaceae bacterium]